MTIVPGLAIDWTDGLRWGCANGMGCPSDAQKCASGFVRSYHINWLAPVKNGAIIHLAAASALSCQSIIVCEHATPTGRVTLSVRKTGHKWRQNMHNSFFS